MNVVLRPASRILRPAPALLIWALACMLYGEEKPIRLRNETLLTPPRPANPVAAPAPQGVEGVSGLYLVQFTGRFDPAWQAELRAHGVEPLTYVPEDAFVSRLTGASLASVRSLPYVRWVGEFRPGHKVHSLVESWMRNLPAGETRPVGILLSPAATGPERAAVEGLFEKVEQRAGARRFGGLLRGVVHRRSLQALLASPAVLWVEPAPRLRLVDEVSSKIVAGDGGAQKLWTQSLGFDGSGVRVAVADSGIDTGDLSNLHPDIAGRVVSLFYYGDLENASDGHSHGTHVTGIIAGNGAVGETDENGFLYGLGVAPGVEIIGQRIFDDAGGFQAPPSNESLTRDAVRAGADIGSNSWGDDTQGRYDLNAAEFDGLVRDADALTPGDQQYILEFSAGNAGPGSQTMDSPAVAKNVIATGASENDRPDLLIYADGVDVVADFSSRGPCEDGRIKPDVVAPGTWIASLKSSFATDENAWAAISDNYMYQGGTSQAGPHASGAAAVFVQYYRELFGNKPSPALVKAALINSAVDMDDQFGTGPIPNNDEGWGRIDLTGLIASPTRESRFIDQTVLLHTGQVYEYRVVVLSAEEPLKFTLAYTDVPGFPGAIPALVNDLDLEVVGPDGTVYHGNQFQDGESIPNALGVDSLNNVEGVHLALPIPGEYVVRVVARNVPQDSRIDTASVDQDFALVVSGSLPGEGVSAVLLDRGAYTAPSVMRIAVLDPNAGGRPSLEVGVVSTTEPLGERITLHPGTLSIYFTGTVATVSGHATPDGRLQVAHGDTVTATYGSASKTARIDLLPPLITEVAATNVFASTSILWTTDEPATSMVYYGLTASLGQSVTNRSLELQGAV
ncbi:MAG TPA: hypothetical protein DCM86_15055, partial [Verrucomicrobiales bacterium]|nr:hypothetical protein [Verrucomicrobiales bacterium]